jgi:hypothetical protein
MPANPCPACGQAIAAADINVAEGVGLCRACGKLSRLRDIAEQPVVDPKTFGAPPPGCWLEEGMGGARTLRASLRSAGAAAVTLFICLFWNGIVSVFVLIAIAGVYTNLVGPLPQWFPAPSSGKRGNLGPDMSTGATLFLCIFLIPFVLVGLGMFVAFLTCVIGRVEVLIDGPVGRVRTGFGPFNWTRRFDPTQVKRVVEERTSYQENGRSKPLIQIDADRTVKLGSMLEDRRREWLIGALHLLLVARKSGTFGARARSG